MIITAKVDELNINDWRESRTLLILHLEQPFLLLVFFIFQSVGAFLEQVPVDEGMAIGSKERDKYVGIQVKKVKARR